MSRQSPPKQWLRLSQKTIDKLSDSTQATMQKWAEMLGKGSIAKSRYDELNSKKARSPQAKMAAIILLGGLSAITFSAGAQIITGRLGKWSIPAALVLGGAAGILAEQKATKILTHQRLKVSTKQVLANIKAEEQSQQPNTIGVSFYQSQQDLVRQLEGQHLSPLPAFDLGLAGGLSAAEYAMSLTLIIGLGLPGGVVLNAIAASLPVAMLWAAASWQADHFEIPEKVQELPQKYEPYLLGEVNHGDSQEIAMINEQIEHKEEEIEYEKALQERQQEYCDNGDPSGRLQNWTMAEADFKRDWYQEKQERLMQDRDRLIEQRLFQLQADLAQLEAKFIKPQQPIFAPQEVEKIKKAWIEEQEGKLREMAHQEIKWLQLKAENEFNLYDQKIKEAKQQYEEAKPGPQAA